MKCNTLLLVNTITAIKRSAALFNDYNNIGLAVNIRKQNT